MNVQVMTVFALFMIMTSVALLSTFDSEQHVTCYQRAHDTPPSQPDPRHQCSRHARWSVSRCALGDTVEPIMIIPPDLTLRFLDPKATSV